MTTIDYNAEPLLHVEGLKQHFRISRTYTTKAVDGSISETEYADDLPGSYGMSESA